MFVLFLFACLINYRLSQFSPRPILSIEFLLFFLVVVYLMNIFSLFLLHMDLYIFGVLALYFFLLGYALNSHPGKLSVFFQKIALNIKDIDVMTHILRDCAFVIMSLSLSQFLITPLQLKIIHLWIFLTLSLFPIHFPRWIPCLYLLPHSILPSSNLCASSLPTT